MPRPAAPDFGKADRSTTVSFAAAASRLVCSRSTSPNQRKLRSDVMQVCGRGRGCCSGSPYRRKLAWHAWPRSAIPSSIERRGIAP
jgi:hypothetical protein